MAHETAVEADITAAGSLWLLYTIDLLGIEWERPQASPQPLARSFLSSEEAALSHGSVQDKSTTLVEQGDQSWILYFKLHQSSDQIFTSISQRRDSSAIFVLFRHCPTPCSPDDNQMWVKMVIPRGWVVGSCEDWVLKHLINHPTTPLSGHQALRSELASYHRLVDMYCITAEWNTWL